MVNMTNELVSREVITNRDGQWEVQSTFVDDTIGVPENLRQLIQQQLARVNLDERKILEAASVAGADFSAAAVAAGVEQATETVETHCDDLVHREQFLRTQGTSEWPDGTIATRYGFVHALYQEVVYDQLSATRRIRLHRQIGEREEQGYGDRAREIATELAVHFERGRDYRKAVQYLQHAGENAVRRSAYQEAITLLTKGLELLKALPDTPERIQQELTLQIALNGALLPVKGYTAPEVEKIVLRAWELCQQIGQTPQLSPVLWRLWTFYDVGGKFQKSRELGEQLLSLAQSVQDPALLLEGHAALGYTLHFLGEFIPAREHLEAGIALYDPQQHRSYGTLFDPKVGYLSYTAWVLWFLGYPDQAQQRSHEALTLAQELSHPFSLAYALHHAARLHQLRREVQAVQERAEAVIALTTEQGFPVYLAAGTIWRGCALAEQGQVEEGIRQICQGLVAWQATGAEQQRPYWLALLAEAYGKVGEAEQGLATLVEALTHVEQTGERWYEAELYRLKGELLLAQARKLRD